MSNHFTEDTIVAIATPPGVGAISIIRVSGSNSIATADLIFKGKNKLSDSKSHSIHYGKILDESEIIDKLLKDGEIFQNVSGRVKVL